MKHKVFILLIISLSAVTLTKDRTIYIAKNYWHTGIILINDEFTSSKIPSLTSFPDSVLIDIGMGEKDFYMNPGREIGPAAKAILIPTDATIRIAEVPGDTVYLRRVSDFLVELRIDSTSFDRMLESINLSIKINEEGTSIIIEQRANGRIVFYESTESYHLFNTCNTWLANILADADFGIRTDVVTSKELFFELMKVGKVLKFDTTDSIF